MKLWKAKFVQSIASLLMIVLFAATGATTQAAVHFTLQGSASDSNFGVQSQSTRSVSGSVATDLGNYFRIGITHREDVSNQVNRSDDATSESYVDTTTNLSANSLDLTVILYYGEVFVPYLMGGIIVKNYDIVSTKASGEKVHAYIPGGPQPNAGVGMGIRLNKDFSLKLSYSVSPGYTQDTSDGEPRRVLDPVTSVGITYDL